MAGCALYFVSILKTASSHASKLGPPRGAWPTQIFFSKTGAKSGLNLNRPRATRSNAARAGLFKLAGTFDALVTADEPSSLFVRAATICGSYLAQAHAPLT